MYMGCVSPRPATPCPETSLVCAGGYAVLSLFFVHGYKLLTKRQGMGEGDPLLVAMIGAFLGVQGAMISVFAGAAQGLVVGLALTIYRRRTGSGPQVPLLEEEMERLRAQKTHE